MITQFVNGLLAYFRALGFISKRGIGRYFIYSGLIGIIIFSICIWTIYQYAPYLGSWVESIIPFDIDFNLKVSNFLSYILSSILFLSIFKYLMLIFTAPIMSALSEKVEAEITGYSSGKNVVLNIIPEIVRSLRINLRNIIRELFLTIVILLLGFIPVVGFLSAFLILFVQGYYAGFGNYDFWAERHFDYRDTIQFMKRRKGMLTANGIVYVFLIAIPLLGAFVGPPLATIACTLEGTKELEHLDY